MSGMEERAGKRVRKRDSKIARPSGDRDSGVKNDILDPFVVIGGGIAGVSCAQQLTTQTERSIVLISATPALKQAVSVLEVTEHLHDIAVYERSFSCFTTENPRIEVAIGIVVSIDPLAKLIHLSDGRTFKYFKVCLCTGATPSLLVKDHANVIGIRDVDSLDDLLARLKDGQKIIVVGNGGIALELIFALQKINIAVDWIVKDSYLGSAFFDATSSEFIMPKLRESISTSEGATHRTPRSNQTSRKNEMMSFGLGPEWDTRYEFSKILSENSNLVKHGPLKIHYSQEVSSIEESDSSSGFKLAVRTSAGERVYGDFIVSATGVKAETSFLSSHFYKMDDGSVVVDESMMTNISDIYAAGDCCAYRPTTDLDSTHSVKLWFQMKLWSQAKSMGIVAAQAMIDGPSFEGSFSFEIFAHITRFFGYKVVLLGNYNAQGLELRTQTIAKEFIVDSDGKLKQLFDPTKHSQDYCGNTSKRENLEIWVRISAGKEYLKLVVLSGRLIGAMLIGNVELSETFENLILNQTDISHIGIDILNPDVDVEDYFD